MSSDDNMNEFVECSICMLPFDELTRVPRLLQCQHSFCDLCIENLAKTNLNREKYTLQCPVCREEHIQNRNKEIAKNRLIINFIQLGTKNNQKATAAPAEQQQQAKSTTKQTWNLNDYLIEIFDDIDADKDGFINETELREALRRGQPDSKFDSKTISILVDRYDRNRDRTISATEFQDLFIYINNEYEAFLSIDSDGSGSIDANELIEFLIRRKNLDLSHEFQVYIKERLEKNSRGKLTFDSYCRLVIRLDNLKHNYENFKQSKTFENYLRAHLFENFW